MDGTQAIEKGTQVMEITNKAFDSLPEDKKKEGFTNLIENVEKCDAVKFLKKKWNTLTEKQKLKLYKMNPISIGGVIKSQPVYKIGSSTVNGVKNTIKEGGKNAMSYRTMEQLPCRFFVELGILDKPEGLDSKKLLNDIKKDAKNYNMWLGLCKTACMVIPDAQVVVPFLSAAKVYTKWYEKNGVPLVQERIKNKESSKLETSVASDLSAVEQDVVKSEVIDKNK